MREKSETWEGVLALFSFLFAETTATLTVAPALYDVPLILKIIMTAGFGLLLAASIFLMGLPMVSAMRSLCGALGRWRDGRRAISTQKS